MGINDLDDAAFHDLYGPWAGRTPADAARFFDGCPGLWWIAGGWALQAFTGVERHHDDVDPSFLRDDLPHIRQHCDGTLHLWSAFRGALRPLLPDDPDTLPPDCGQLWARRNALSPWEYDILLTPGTPETWVYRRDPSLTLPMADALWERDGIRYLQPEIQLLYKAKGLRAKDQADFTATLPHLDSRRRTWLRDALNSTIGEHPWLEALR